MNTEEKVDEYRFLPEEPGRMTYRRRYEHIDNHLCAYLIDFRSVSRDKKMRVLDIGCGVSKFGSPTLHDLWDAMRDKHYMPTQLRFVGVDVCAAEVVTPTYPIQYITDLRDLSAREQFDIIRMLRIVEHVTSEEYERLRREGLSRVRDGGFFICTQQLGRWKLDSCGYDLRKLSPIIKIMQRRRRTFVTVALLPDALLPPACAPFFGDDAERREYVEYRRAVMAGEKSLERALDYHGFGVGLSYLRGYSTGVLSQQSLDWLVANRLIGRIDEPALQFEMRDVLRAAANAAAWFGRGRKKEESK